MPLKQLKRVDGTVILESTRKGETLDSLVVRAWCEGLSLRGVDLGGMCALGFDFGGVDLRGADLRGAYLRDADLSECDLRGAILPEGVPVVPDIDRAILAAVRKGGELNMGCWHWDGPCGTSHCRAGWAIHLAGDAGYDLEEKVGPSAAGALIYAASRPDKPVPDFYTVNDEAMADIEACAAEQGGA